MSETISMERNTGEPASAARPSLVDVFREEFAMREEACRAVSAAEEGERAGRADAAALRRIANEAEAKADELVARAIASPANTVEEIQAKLSWAIEDEFVWKDALTGDLGTAGMLASLLCDMAQLARDRGAAPLERGLHPHGATARLQVMRARGIDLPAADPRPGA